MRTDRFGDRDLIGGGGGDRDRGVEDRHGWGEGQRQRVEDRGGGVRTETGG